MGRGAFVLPIRPSKVDEYVAAHRAVWPDMIDALRTAGIHNYSIYLHDAQAFGYFEADNPAAALANVGQTDVDARWQAQMATLLEQHADGGRPGLLPEIFRME